MTVGRTELALALDDMDENQDGVRFQRMALQLVRQAWPQIVCSEPGKDLGVDARIPTSLAADGVGRAFACSITPTYAKILADARKIRVNYPSLKVMIFATPAGVPTAPPSIHHSTASASIAVGTSQRSIILEIAAPGTTSARSLF